jgi:hypothetical protein
MQECLKAYYAQRTQIEIAAAGLFLPYVRKDPYPVF